MSVYRHFATAYPKPVICEMGGKNPMIVSAKADLDKAAAGVARSAFGFTGQKCSACSRVYVQRDGLSSDFVAKLAEQARVAGGRRPDATRRVRRPGHRRRGGGPFRGGRDARQRGGPGRRGR